MYVNELQNDLEDKLKAGSEMKNLKHMYKLVLMKIHIIFKFCYFNHDNVHTCTNKI